jgi:hypothetical protein
MPDPSTYRYGNLEEYNWLMGEVLKHETAQALHLGELLYSRFSPVSVIDIGGGPGVYLLPFKQHGAKVLCVDGAPAAGGSVDASEFELVDLRNPYQPTERYSLALCIEVAEHLQPEHADTLVETLVHCADRIYFSAARPNQGGEGHYNEQDKAYWLDKFSRYGYRLSPYNGEIQSVVNDDPVYDHCHWLRWNGMLIERSE